MLRRKNEEEKKAIERLIEKYNDIRNLDGVCVDIKIEDILDGIFPWQQGNNYNFNICTFIAIFEKGFC